MLSKQEAVDLLTRLSDWDLVQLLACKAAGNMAAGGPSLSMECDAQAPNGPTVVVRVRITKKRIRSGKKGTP